MIHVNRSVLRGQPLSAEDVEFFGAAAPTAAIEVLARWRPYQPSPLRLLPALAKRVGVARIAVQDESGRFGLGSFKALGGAHAVLRLVLGQASARLGRTVTSAELQHPDVAAVARSITVACATDGNHGRSVASGATFLGCRCVVFVHERVSEARVAAIAACGAQVRRVPGNYDDSVREALRVASTEGWMVVSDTSWAGYERIPRLVMQGYTVMVHEALQALQQQAPTHVFVQAGVGGLAAAVAAHLNLVLPTSQRPHVIVVEPEHVACVLRSAAAGKPMRLPVTADTIMAMLECYEPSPVALNVLQRCAAAFMTVNDAAAIRAMNEYGNPSGGDPRVVAGESGAAGLAGLLTLLADSGSAADLQLGAQSRVLLFNTEGATDPDLYRKYTGIAP